MESPRKIDCRRPSNVCPNLGNKSTRDRNRGTRNGTERERERETHLLRVTLDSAALSCGAGPGPPLDAAMCFPLRSSRSRLIVSPHVLSRYFLLFPLPFLATLPVVLTRWLQASKIPRRPRHRHEACLQHARKTHSLAHSAPTLGLLPTTARLPRRPSFKLPRGDYLVGMRSPALNFPTCVHRHAKKGIALFFSFCNNLFSFSPVTFLVPTF
jgi:hypothetical protein